MDLLSKVSAYILLLIELPTQLFFILFWNGRKFGFSIFQVEHVFHEWQTRF